MKRLLASLLATAVLSGCNSTANFTQPEMDINNVSALTTFTPQAGSLNGELLINGALNSQMLPNTPAQWSFSFKDQAGQPVTQFDLEHYKYMHLISVSSDLSTFSHMHPTLNNDGSLKIDVNKPSTDPDNQDTKSVTPKAGNYFLFTEVKPKSQKLMQTRFNVNTKGAESPLPINVDPQIEPNKYQKFFNEKSVLGKPGDKYKVHLHVYKMGQGDGGMIHFIYNIQKNVSTSGAPNYQDVKDLQSWLGMDGHAIVVSKAGNTAKDKIFMHLHAGHHDHGDLNIMTKVYREAAGPKIEFVLVGASIPPAGVYKIWCQFKHQNQIFTAPFVVQI